ncbi:MAG: YbhN family protein, partial [Trebonia sp.]
APAGDGRRRRRGTDGMRLAAAVVALVCCLLIIHYDSRIDRAIVAVIHPPPWSITWLVTVVYQAGSFGVVIVLVGMALLARRWEIARDIGLSAVGAAAVTGLLILWLGNHGGRPGGVVIGDYDLSFPVLRIALFAAVATAALPYLARGLQVIVEIFITLVALATAVGGHGLPLNVVGSLVIGWGTTAVVRLAFGSPLGLPSADDVRRLLAEFGISVGHLQPMPQQAWGAAKYEATEYEDTEYEATEYEDTEYEDTEYEDTETVPGDSSRRLTIAVYGRDAAGGRLLTKAGRFLLYRDSGPTLTLTRLQQVQREAFFALRAGQAGVAVPELVEAGTAGPSKDAVLVYRLPSAISLAEAGPDDVGDGALDDIYRQLLILRKARIAHGAISGDALLIDPAGQTAVLADFRNATGSASVDQLDQDLAGALAATAVTVGAERAGDAAARCLAPEVLAGALRHLHKPALDPAIWRRLRSNSGLLDEVRQQAARSASIELPELAQPRRVSWPTLILIIGTLIGGWALIGVLIDVSKSFDTVIGADWLWVIIALVLAQLAYASSAVETLGSVSGPLPFGRALAVEVANAFSGLAGGAPAVFATRVRFYQKQGYDATVALSSGAIMTVASWIATTVVFLVSLPFAWGSIHLEATPESGGDSKLVWIILAVVVLAGVVIGLALAVPRLRRLAAAKLRPRIRDVWGNLRQVASSPRKLLLLLGGALGRELLIAMALSVSLRAFGDHLRLPVIIVVIVLAAIVGAVAPSPGGMGVVEAGMILGLTAAGVSEADATAAVFIQRLFTSYLPPIWGWFTLVWLRGRDYL